MSKILAMKRYELMKIEEDYWAGKISANQMRAKLKKIGHGQSVVLDFMHLEKGEEEESVSE